MISTTLMTFLLITKPEIRSVKLLGSWDNFSKPYAMERDKRAGSGHWKGCHTFTDIMGDGPGDNPQWRTGGLKMGATYWYYYLLDDDAEHFNEAEPVTTQCPLLPGQPLNVLNVPIILPDSRSHGRSNSGSSQKSDYRTMNPEDKFMNPRKPPKPSPTRLQTSAANYQPAAELSSVSPGGSLIHRSASQPISAKYGKQATNERSVSPAFPEIREAFRSSNRSPNEMEGHKQALSRSKTHAGTPRKERFFEDGRDIPGIKLSAGPVSTGKINDMPGPSTIQSRRAMKANAVQAKNLLTVETRPHRRQNSASRWLNETQAIKDAIPDEQSSSDMSTPTGPDPQEKRLPSLPNTPSSVMDEAVRAIDERDKAMDAQVPRSYFSSMTATTDESILSRVVEQSRFSEWSTDTEAEDTSPESMVSASTFNGPNESPTPEEWGTPDLAQHNDAATNTDPNTPHLTVYSKPSSPNSASDDVPTWNLNTLPQLTVSMSPSHGSGLGIEPMEEVESNPKRHAALFSAIESMQALSLSRSPDGSPIILSEMQGPENEANDDDRRRKNVDSQHSNASLHGNPTMQEMLDELSYLKNMIQTEMDGEPF
ncbi:uncharacterized protein N7498_005731 [Penicillium cinerascens]|uniref:Uncharacterized protein n=1 Tax=Penicillium cinerascens TaxID=70096 RepID=A0A9W9MP00_9EURO|nr:uncharacterized protein N7498_005731 [Penicillium cinerascens]KAJ5204852.1 hypothetical protein N7498_005731 [Penicillium cinerascens]